jgi:3-ketosteroid 9alpha-monooxygenase subunit B
MALESEIPAVGRVHRLRVSRVTVETPDARSIAFEVPPELQAEFRHKAGQFLTVTVPLGGLRLRRCYSLASSPDVDREHSVTVKRVPGGRVSTFLVEQVRVGDWLEVERPAGRFVLTADTSPLHLYGAGSGITPLISMIKTALASTDRRVELFYANRDEASIIFRGELEGLVRAHPGRLAVHHWLDAARGFVGAADVVRGPEGAHHYLCGPGPFMSVVEGALVALGVPPSHLHVERFVSPPDPTPTQPGDAVAPVEPPATGEAAVVLVEHEGTTLEVPCPPGMTLLEAALAAGMDAPYSCKEGFCGCCSALLLEGEVKMDADDALTPEAKRRGLILACQSRPRTGRCSIRFVEY